MIHNVINIEIINTSPPERQYPDGRVPWDEIIKEFISSHPRVYIKDYYEDHQAGEIKMVLQSDEEGGGFVLHFITVDLYNPVDILSVMSIVVNNN